MTSPYRKSLSSAPSDAARWEASGLRWLATAEAAGGARAVRVLAVADTHLDLEPLLPAPPTPQHAEAFGRALVRTHGAGAQAYGSPPDGWVGPGWLGPSNDLLPLPTTPSLSWGAFYAEHRLRHTLRLGADRRLWTTAREREPFERVARRLETGELDDTTDGPARLHGDLWSGNVVWTDAGAVLIDPAAHGGHPETDLAMLALFGAPHLDRILAAYDEESPLADGWQDRVALHQLHPVMLHAVLFGGGYVRRAEEIARHYA